MIKFFVIKTYSDIDLAPIVELRYGFGVFSKCIAEYSNFYKANKVAKKLNNIRTKTGKIK